MRVYVRRVNFTTNQNIKLQSFKWMNSQDTTFEKNTQAQRVQMGRILLVHEADVITHLSLATRESFQAKKLRGRLSKKQIPPYLKNKCSSLKASVKVTAKKYE